MHLNRYILITFIFLIIKSSFIFAQRDEQDEFSKNEGKIIRNIFINRMDVGGPSFYDKKKQDTSWLGRIANMLHFKTRKWVVDQRLLFTTGDKINAKIFAESERLLRSDGAFNDAKIEILSDSSSSQDSVDVLVTTKDKWTLALIASYNADKKNSYFGIKDDNLMGLGHSINAQFSYNNTKTIGPGADIKYSARNVMGSFGDANFNFHNNKSKNLFNLNFTRPFLSTETDFAGGIDLTFEKNVIEYYNFFGLPTIIPFSNNSQDIWVGKSFDVSFGPSYFKNSSKIITAYRISNKKYNNRPLVTPTFNRIFENSSMMLFSLGVIYQRFYKDIYIDGFGITEDIPIGGIVNFTAGNENREFSSRNYFGIESVFSRRIENVGYISGKFASGGFYNKNHWEQKTVNINIIYHTPLLKSNNWYIRGFLQNDFTLGYSRFTGEEIFLSSDKGIRGIDKFLVYGTKAGILNLEARFFSPYSIIGFRFGANLFIDLGFITGRQQNLFSGPLYQGYGIGIRTRNESISRAEFIINFIYNPRHPNLEKSDFSIMLKSSLVLGIRNFGINKPSVIEYGEN